MHFGKISPRFSLYPADMTICLSHISALQALRALRFQGWNPQATKAGIPAFTPILEVRNYAARRPWLNASNSQNIHIAIAKQQRRSKAKGIVTHIVTCDDSNTLLIENESPVTIPSLGFLLVQLAQSVPFCELVEIAFEMCGSYSLAPDGSSFASCARAITAKKLNGQISRIGNMRGVEQARRAASCVIDGSASPAETKLAMLLCLRRTLGGYGLPKPTMNERIFVTEAARASTPNRSFVCDLYWKNAKLDVEYDSDQFHASSEGIASDAQRRNALQLMGFTVITATRKQMRDRDAFDDMARAIAKIIGYRLPRANARWLDARNQLREALLSPRNF